MGRGAPNWLTGCSVPDLPRYFSTTFLKNCGRDKSLTTTTCFRTEADNKQGDDPSKILSLQHSLFFVSVKFFRDHKAYKDEVKSG